LAVVVGMKKTNDHTEPIKSRTLKKPTKKLALYNLLVNINSLRSFIGFEVFKKCFEQIMQFPGIP